MAEITAWLKYGELLEGPAQIYIMGSLREEAGISRLAAFPSTCR